MTKSCEYARNRGEGESVDVSVGRPAAADPVVVATAAIVATCVRVAIELVDGAELVPFLPLSTS